MDPPKLKTDMNRPLLVDDSWVVSAAACGWNIASETAMVVKMSSSQPKLRASGSRASATAERMEDVTISALACCMWSDSRPKSV